MPKKRWIVIDASVAQSAGSGEKPNKFSLPSRATLKTVEVCHKIVFSADCFKEWDRHEREFARAWRRRMVAKKQVIFLGKTENVELRESLVATAKHERQREAILKDAHLVEAALQTDQIVI